MDITIHQRHARHSMGRSWDIHRRNMDHSLGQIIHRNIHHNIHHNKCPIISIRCIHHISMDRRCPIHTICRQEPDQAILSIIRNIRVVMWLLASQCQRHPSIHTEAYRWLDRHRRSNNHQLLKLRPIQPTATKVCEKRQKPNKAKSFIGIADANHTFISIYS